MKDQPTARELKERLDLRSFIPEIVRRYSRYVLARCPFHNDSTPSLVAYRKAFTCLACGERGDIFNYYAKLRGISFREAFLALYNQVNLTLPPTNFGLVEVEPSINLKPVDWKVVERYVDRRRRTPHVLQYLHQVRGLADETLDHFQVGYTGSRYAIPIIEGGVVWNIRFRADPTIQSEATAKYTSLAGRGGNRLFNSDILPTVRGVVIVEGEFDVIMLHQNQIPAVSATAGAGTWQRAWEPRLTHLDRVFVLFDKDMAGIQGAARIASFLGEKAKQIYWPDWLENKEDVTDWFVKYKKTRKDFLNLLRGKNVSQL